MGSSSGPSARGTYYIGDEYGEVQIRSIKALGLGAHHLVRFDMPRDSKRNWAIFEWLSDGENFYACDSICTNYCINLGNYYLKDVYNAAKRASKGASYGTRYNCNHWCQQFAKYLGHSITVHWNCSCVL